VDLPNESEDRPEAAFANEFRLRGLPGHRQVIYRPELADGGDNQRTTNSSRPTMEGEMAPGSLTKNAAGENE